MVRRSRRFESSEGLQKPRTRGFLFRIRLQVLERGEGVEPFIWSLQVGWLRRRRRLSLRGA